MLTLLKFYDRFFLIIGKWNPEKEAFLDGLRVFEKSPIRSYAKG
jgi:hypothetical protein